jgi:hypothetical protein
MLPHSLLGPDMFLSTLFSNTLSLCSSLTVRDKFHTHTKQQAIKENIEKENQERFESLFQDFDWLPLCLF